MEKPLEKCLLRSEERTEVTETSRLPSEGDQTHKSIDQIIEENVGQFSLYQLFAGVFVFYAQAAMATGVYASVFSDYTTKHHCLTDNNSSDYKEDHYQSETLRCFTPQGDICQEFVYDTSIYSSSASQEFNIVCENSYLKGLSGVFRMSGLLVGSFVFGWMSDILGRVTSITVAGCVLVSAQILNVFSWNYLMFSILNMLSAAAGIGVFLVAYVFIFEWAAPAYRTKVCVFAQVPFSIGFLYVVLVAFFIRTWRNYQLFLVVPNLLLLAYNFILPESPRWLTTKGKMSEARKSLEFAANMNKKPLRADVQISELTGEAGEVTGCTEEEDVNISTLVRESFLFYRLLILSWNWVVITLAFYGLSLNSARDENLFQNVAAMAAVEMPAYIFCVFIIDTWERRPILTICQILAGLSCLSAGLVPSSLPVLKLVFALVGKMGASAGFAVVYVYTAELFPTKVRNSAIGLCSTFARVGGMVAPLISDLEAIYEPLPFLVMGGAAVSAGLLAFLLPETRGKSLPQTLQQAKLL